MGLVNDEHPILEVPRVLDEVQVREDRRGLCLADLEAWLAVVRRLKSELAKPKNLEP
jgi:hypothetical protein